jgi:hypothetical protein
MTRRSSAFHSGVTVGASPGALGRQSDPAAEKACEDALDSIASAEDNGRNLGLERP